MCEFCLRHGEGEKWYLQAKNYSEDLLSDIRRIRFIQGFADPKTLEMETKKAARGFESLEKTPWLIRSLYTRLISRRMKKVHFGQVLPIEDVERIFDFTNSIVRVACICRKFSLGLEKRYCYGISLGPNGGKLRDLFEPHEKDFSGGVNDKRFEMLTKEEALELFRGYELEGLCHTVWTFHTPFIGGICNCDRVDCLAMRSTITHEVPAFFRAEYVAEIDRDLCTGCRQCMRLCQFGALTYSTSVEKSFVDQRRCYGCGICRSACKADAIRLLDRASSPVAANLW
jgi:Pyruvate/2-oxoacid:ferredoxin oxidoreductase delta subunit